VAELTQSTLGLVRDVLSEMGRQYEPVTAFERIKFWKEKLFDAGFSQSFIEIAKSYQFEWTDIIPALNTAKFGEQNVHFGTLIPPTLCEEFLARLVKFAVSENNDTPLGERLRTAIETDLDAIPNAQSSIPAELTGLPDRASLGRDLLAHIQNGRLVSLMFIDLDNFKQVNDQHGHGEGDRCLLEVIANISTAILGKGKLYRVGGDEFCAVLPNFSDFEAAATAERIRASVDALPLFGGATKVTVSVGVVASNVQRTTDPQFLVSAADEAMYISKWTKKNCVTTWPASDADRQWAKENRERAKSGAKLILDAPDQKNPKHQKNQKQAREQLAAFLMEADGIRRDIEFNNSASLQQRTEWELKVKQFLASLDNS
jgi:diguanylate cyclase (GGDEF)-like protein